MWPHSGQHVSSCDVTQASNMTYTYDNSGHENDDEKVNYVADNKNAATGEAIKPGTEWNGTNWDLCQF